MLDGMIPATTPDDVKTIGAVAVTPFTVTVTTVPARPAVVGSVRDVFCTRVVGPMFAPKSAKIDPSATGPLGSTARA
jgi:hypothetical protein